MQQGYWKQGADLSMPIFLHKMDTEGRVHAPQIPATALPMFGFMFLTSGQVLLEVGGHPVLLHSGEFLLIPQNTPFSIKYYQDSVGYTGGFRESFLKDASHPILREEEYSVQTFIREDALFVGGIFKRMQEAFPKEISYLKSGLDFILSHLHPDKHQEGSNVAVKYIDMVFDRSQTITSVGAYAEQLEVSADLLNHYVRRYSNHSAMEWIEISRMALARDLLINTELPVSAISEAVGIMDPSYFSRFFSKKEGMTPMAFRKKYSKKS